jgi:hypothetical protein
VRQLQYNQRLPHHAPFAISATFSANNLSVTLLRLLQRRARRPGDTVKNFTCALSFGLDFVRLDLFGDGTEVRTDDEQTVVD